MALRLLSNPNSPFVHKVLLVARELGIRDRISVEDVSVSPLAGVTGTQVTDANPLGKIPTLIVSGTPPTAIFDSSVIVQYLDTISPLKKVLASPSDTTRYNALTVEALADGVLDAALLLRYEIVVRSAEHRHQAWTDGQQAKIKRGIIHLAKLQLPDPASQGALPLQGIATATVLWYLGRRFPELGWSTWEGGAKLAEWYDQVKTRPGWSEEDLPVV